MARVFCLQLLVLLDQRKEQKDLLLQDGVEFFQSVDKLALLFYLAKSRHNLLFEGVQLFYILILLVLPQFLTLHPTTQNQIHQREHPHTDALLPIHHNQLTIHYSYTRHLLKAIYLHVNVWDNLSHVSMVFESQGDDFVGGEGEDGGVGVGCLVEEGKGTEIGGMEDRWDRQRYLGEEGERVDGGVEGGDVDVICCFGSR